MSPQVHPALHGGLILCKMFIIVQYLPALALNI